MINYKVKQQDIIDFNTSKPICRKEVIIVRSSNKNDNVFIPSCLTDYLFHYHSNDSINTKLSSAYKICSFMNYLIYQVALKKDDCFACLKENGLHGLNHFHLAKYINSLSNNLERKNSYETVKKKEEVLINLYDFLFSRGVTSNSARILRKIVAKNNSNKSFSTRGHYVLISPFEGNSDITIKYPTKNNEPSRILKYMNKDVWEQFIEYAEEFYPKIALGLAFQIMGGIRLGEVVNLCLDSVELHRHSQHIRLNIQDRQNELFGDRSINTNKSQVKNPRVNQPVFNFNGRLFELWDNHIKMITTQQTKKTRALFLDNDGQPMSGDTYEEYFRGLKEDYLEFLDARGHLALAKHLREHKWSTHIGRHIYTNYLIKTGAINTANGQPNPEYLRILRGDRSINSAAEYIDTKVIIETVTEKLNLISEICKKV